MPAILYDIIELIASLICFLGMGVLGVALGWLVLDLFKKTTDWKFQMALFLGFLGLIIAMVVYLPWGALGAFAIGAGVALLLWGMPKKEKKEEEE